MIEKLRIPKILDGQVVNVGMRHNKFFIFAIDSYYPYKANIIKCTGWIWHTATRKWYIDGEESTAEEVFEILNDEQKLEAIFEMNEWK